MPLEFRELTCLLTAVVATVGPAQVFYPVEKSRVAKLPWFPSSSKRFRRSLAPAIGEAQRAPFGLTQVPDTKISPACAYSAAAMKALSP